MKTTEPGRDAIALVLAVGLCTALNCFTFAVLWDAISSQEPGLSENATQILTGWGGGIIGILGAVFGYRAGQYTSATSSTTSTTSDELREPDE